MFCFTRPDINRPKADHSNKPVSSGERKETEIEVRDSASVPDLHWVEQIRQNFCNLLKNISVMCKCFMITSISIEHLE